MPETTACETCTSLLHEALNLTVRGRTLDGIQRRADTLAASREPEEWQASGRFDDHVTRHNLTCDPWKQIETRSATPQLWVEDQFQRELHDWEARARKHLMNTDH
ncbi:hypothetical protein [Paracoccus fontiphilus]|uniref:Uncharacterized protein n=1 Tax=Paracoccus fontiphilus TaxID=1815556 RepID=A0ABV7IKM8_9RHOB|nr:hypothetical protein [Paracoccus fontiphilus]